MILSETTISRIHAVLKYADEHTWTNADLMKLAQSKNPMWEHTVVFPPYSALYTVVIMPSEGKLFHCRQLSIRKIMPHQRDQPPSRAEMESLIVHFGYKKKIEQYLNMMGPMAYHVHEIIPVTK